MFLIHLLGRIERPLLPHVSVHQPVQVSGVGQAGRQACRVCTGNLWGWFGELSALITMFFHGTYIHTYTNIFYFNHLTQFLYSSLLLVTKL